MKKKGCYCIACSELCEITFTWLVGSRNCRPSVEDRSSFPHKDTNASNAAWTPANFSPEGSMVFGLCCLSPSPPPPSARPPLASAPRAPQTLKLGVCLRPTQATPADPTATCVSVAHPDSPPVHTHSPALAAQAAAATHVSRPSLDSCSWLALPVKLPPKLEAGTKFRGAVLATRGQSLQKF